MADEVYKIKKPDGTFTYMTPKDGQWVEVPAPIESAPHASTIQQQGMDKFLANDGTLLSRFEVNKNGPPVETAFKLGGNSLAQVLDVIPASIGGAISATGMLAKGIGNAVTAESPTDLYNAGNAVGSDIANQMMKDRLTWEGFSKNPLTIPLDIASVVSPLLRGGSTLSKIKGANSYLKNKIVGRYVGNAANETFNIPEFGLNNVTAQGVKGTSTVQDIVDTSRQFNMHPPTVGQLTGDARALQAELMNPELENVLQSQNEGIARGLQHFLEQPELNGTNRQINLSMDTSQATGVIRNQIVKGIKAEQSFLNKRRENTIHQLGKFFSNNAEVDVTDARSVLAYADKFLEQFKGKSSKGIPPDVLQKVQELKGLRRLYDSDSTALYELENSKLVKGISRSQNVLDPRAPKPTHINPDADYSKLIDTAVTSPEMFQRFVRIPGVGKENAAQLLIYKIANESKVPGSQFFDPRKLYEGLTNKDNASMLKTVLDPKARVGLQHFAFTLQKLDRYTPAQLQRMALSLSAKQDTALINVGGSLVPKLLGGNVAQMRAGYGIVQGGYLQLKGKWLGRLLIDPRGSWALSAVAQTPVNSPSLGGRVRQLIKIMGELHIPTVFEINGEEVEVPPMETPIN